MNVDQLRNFSKLLVAFSKVERTLYIPGTDRHENDTEHSYHLALVAWYLVASENLDLDLNLILRYALVHDLVEVYAGDTFTFSSDAAHRASKHDREEAAAARIAKEFPEFPDLHAHIVEYEKRESREAKLVYALDKLVPILINIEDNARAWKEHHVTLDMIRSEKEKKVSVSPEVEGYFNEILKLLENNQEEIFGT